MGSIDISTNVFKSNDFASKLEEEVTQLKNYKAHMVSAKNQVTETCEESQEIIRKLEV